MSDGAASPPPCALPSTLPRPFLVQTRAPVVGALVPTGPHLWPAEAPDPFLELVFQNVADPLGRAAADLRLVETASSREVEALVDDAVVGTVHTLVVVPGGVMRIPDLGRRDLVRFVVRESWEDTRSVAARVAQGLEALVRDRAYYLARTFEAGCIERATEALARRRGLPQVLDPFEFAPLAVTRWGHVCELAGCVFDLRLKVAEALEVRSERWHAIRRDVPPGLRASFDAMRAVPRAEVEDACRALTGARMREKALEDELRALAVPGIGTPWMALHAVEAAARAAAVAVTRSKSEAAKRLRVDRGGLAGA